MSCEAAKRPALQSASIGCNPVLILFRHKLVETCLRLEQRGFDGQLAAIVRMEMEFAGRTQLLRIGSEGESETTQTRINQRCRSPLAAPAQEIAAVAVGQVTVRRITTEREKIDRMPLLPCATQTDASWTFTCETETNTLVRAGQDWRFNQPNRFRAVVGLRVSSCAIPFGGIFLTAPRITVVGSYATGLTMKVERMPNTGETLLGTGYRVDYGGKGSNQAVACARLGAHVSFIARIGTDPFSEMALGLYRDEGIDITT